MAILPPVVPKPPLSRVVINEPILDVDASVSGYLKKNYKTEIILSAIFIALWEIIIIFFALRHMAGGGAVSEDNGRGVIFLMALPLGVAFFIFAKLKNRLLHQFYKQFAQANGFTYQQTGWLDRREGAIFKVGHSKKMEDIIEGEINGLPLSLFNYKYTVGSGKNSHTYEKTVLEIDIKALTPPMLLLADWHGFGDNISDNNLNNVSKISLPADLEKHFSLFTEKKFEIEALQIFTPNFLNLIYGKYPQFSLDFLGQNLYVYAGSVIANKPELDLMLEYARTVSEKIGAKLPAMQGAITAMREALTKNPRGLLEFFKSAGGLGNEQHKILALTIIFSLGIMLLATVLTSLF